MTRRKKWTLFVISVLLVSISIVLINNKTDKKEILSREKVFNLPELNMKQLDGSLYEYSKDESSYKVVLFFSPECDVCEAEIGDIINIFQDNENIRWFFITYSFLYDETVQFLNIRPISKINNALILLDDNMFYHNQFEVYSSPAIFIYNSDDELIDLERGPIPMSRLRKTLGE